MADSLTFLILVTGILAGGTPTAIDHDSVDTYFSCHFPNVNVQVLEYNTVSTSATDIACPMPRLYNSALYLLQKLQCARQMQEARMMTEANHQGEEKDRVKLKTKLVFLAHDIGSFVVKQALLIANSKHCYEWIATGTIAALLFRAPQRLPTYGAWESLVVKMLAESEYALDFLSFLKHLPSYAAHLERDFEGISGCYHMIDFLVYKHDSSTVPKSRQVPVYKCDQVVVLDCEPSEMWQFCEKTPWSKQVLDVIDHHLKLEADDPQEVSRYFLRSLARQHPELHHLGHGSYSSIPTDIVKWISGSWYSDWVNTPENCFLHIFGNPGTGVSLLATKIAAKLQLEDKLVLSFSVGKNHNRSKSTVDLFRSFCQQALLSSSALRSTAQLRSWLIGGEIFTKEAFKGLLCSILSSYAGSSVFCIVDAVHNYGLNLRGELLEDLKHVKVSSQGGFKVLLTSDSLQEWPESLLPYREIDLASEIRGPSTIKLESKLQRLAETRMRNLGTVKPVWRTVQQEDIAKLWTESMNLLEISQKIEFLERANPSSPEDATAMINAISTTFEGFFDHLCKHFGFFASGSLGVAVLPWIIHSIRPMTLSELAVCFALESAAAGDLTVAGLKKKTSWDLRANLDAALGPLITITGEKVKLRHQVYESYLLARPQLQGDIHLQLLVKCIQYLTTINESWNSSHEQGKEFLLTEYATLHWPAHYDRANDKEAACSSVLSLFNDDRTFRKWLEMYTHYSKVPLEHHPTTQIQAAGSFGLTAVLKRLVPSPVPTSEPSTELQQAMNFAAENGHVEAVHYLAAQNVRSESALIRASRTGDIDMMAELLDAHRECVDSPNRPDGVYKLLLEAARYGHTACFEWLLNDRAEKVDMHSATPETKLTAINLASRIGNLAIVRRLIDFRVSLSLADDRGYDALRYAAEAGFADIVSMLIATIEADSVSGASKVDMELLINRQTGSLDTPLHLAASNGHLPTVDILLQERLGANLCIQNRRGYTALHCAAEGGFQTTVQRLLEAIKKEREPGAAPHSEPMADLQSLFAGEFSVPSPLELAVASQHLGTVKELQASKFYDTSKALASALAKACSVGNPDIVQHILRWHRDVCPSDGPLRGEDGNTALHLAAQRGDMAIFRTAKESNLVPIDFKNKQGRRPIHEAVYSGSLSILQQFANEFDFDNPLSDDAGKTPLHLAAQAGHIEIVKWLLRYPAYKREHITVVDGTAVMLAAVNGHKEIVSLLIRCKYANATGQLLHITIRNGWQDVAQLVISDGGESLFNWRDPDTENTALHVAVQTGERDIIKNILEVGTDANIKNKDGKSPFALAMEANNLDIVRVLLDGSQSIEVNEPDGDGLTPLLRACMNDEGDNIGVIRELLTKRSGQVELDVKHPADDDHEKSMMTPLHAATERLEESNWSTESDPGTQIPGSDQENAEDKGTRDDELLQLLLEAGANPNIANEKGSTPLLYASQTGHIRAVKALLGKGAEVNMRNKTGSSALHRAAQFGRTECIKILVAGGANIEAIRVVNGWGVTPLVMAVASGNFAAVEILVTHNAELGRALHFAIAEESLEIVRFFLNKYPYPTIPDPDLTTPLHLVVEAENEELLSLLLENDSAMSLVNSTDLIGRTSLHITVFIESIKMMEMLIKANADVNKRDDLGMTPLYYAILIDNEELVGFLCRCSDIDLSASGPRKQSPLYLACLKGSDEILKLVDTVTAKLGTKKYAELCSLALHAAVQNDSEQSMERFTRLFNVPGVRGDVRDDDGWTALEYAISYNRKELQQVLSLNVDQVPPANDEFPTCWHANDRHPGLFQVARDDMENMSLSPRAVEVRTHIGFLETLTIEGMAVARADHCIPLNRNYYFEITIEKGHKDGGRVFGIGLCDDAAPLDRMLGVGRGIGMACGYHADDGNVFGRNCEVDKESFTPLKYGEGDTVGCGVDVTNKTIYFTKGSHNLGVAIRNIYGKLYPAVFLGTEHLGARISAVFPDANGEGAFKYNRKAGDRGTDRLDPIPGATSLSRRSTVEM